MDSRLEEPAETVIVSVREKVRDGSIVVGGALRRVVGKSGGDRVVALHEVGNLAPFRERLDWLLAHYDVVSVHDLLASGPSARRRIALTFDDGYSFWHEELAPLLRDRHVPAVFFVSSGLVGLSGSAAREFTRRRLARTRTLRFLTLAQLRDLAADPLFEIGGHTVHHVHFGRIADQSLLRREISDDRARLEDWTGSAVHLFAYPFGTPDTVTADARRTLRSLGFSAAFTLVPGGWPSRGEDRYAAGRDGLQPTYSDRQWQARLAGGYDWLYRAKTALVPRRSSRRSEESP
jgi:peptidoglycan/xylan/chitin deacetylase (PgdA/CDA1 family)